MTLTIVEAPPSSLGRVCPGADRVRRRRVVRRSGRRGAAAWRARRCHRGAVRRLPEGLDSYPGGRPPTGRPVRCVAVDLLLVAYDGAQRVGGAVVIGDDPTIDLLRDCSGCALLSDLRVARRGGEVEASAPLSLLAAEETARRHGSRALRVETQRSTCAACRLISVTAFDWSGRARRVRRVAGRGPTALAQDARMIARCVCRGSTRA